MPVTTTEITPPALPEIRAAAGPTAPCIADDRVQFDSAEFARRVTGGLRRPSRPAASGDPRWKGSSWLRPRTKGEITGPHRDTIERRPECKNDWPI